MRSFLGKLYTYSVEIKGEGSQGEVGIATRGIGTWVIQNSSAKRHKHAIR